MSYYQPEIPIWATKEITTGLVCVCVPEPAALFQDRRRRRPSQSILNGASNGFRTNHRRARRLQTFDDELVLGDVELRQEGIRISPQTVFPSSEVVTSIHDGADVRLKTDPHGSIKAIPNAAARIITSVKLEQSVV
ncbi:MAG: hypothetical protein Q9170_004178 [Blastenia crenularia]